MFPHNWAHQKELAQQSKQVPLGNAPCFTPYDGTDMVSRKQLLKKKILTTTNNDQNDSHTPCHINASRHKM